MDEIIFNSKSESPQVQSKISGGKKYQSEGNIAFTRKQKTISEAKRKELEAVYSNVCVHDFDDEYHMSEEERHQRFTYYEAFSKLRRCKRKFRKLDEYVEVFRMTMDVLDLVASNNGVYPKQKFIKMVLKGKIEVFGLTFPKYIGKDRKQINWEYVEEFIEDRTRDTRELRRDKDDNEYFDEMTDEEKIEVLFDKDEWARIEDVIDNPPEYTGEYSYDYDDEDCPDYMVYPADPKFTKELMKENPSLLRCLKDIVKADRKAKIRNNRLNNFVYEMTEDDFEYIQRMDEERGYKSSSDIPVFKGDIMNDNDYEKYMCELERYEREHIKYNYRGQMRTVEEIEEIEVKDMLDEAGWNLRNLYNNKEKEKKLKKAYKKDKKREEELKKQLLAINKRKEKRKGKEIEFNSKKHKKKKEKKKKKESD